MWTRLWKDVAQSGVFADTPCAELVTEAELADLPLAARAHLNFFRAHAETAKHWSFRIAWAGRFRLGPNRPWMPIEAVQYDQRSPVARFFHMRARMKHIVPVLARDTYVAGRGHMHAKLAGLFTVANARGNEFDEGELVTWLNDVVLFAPSMLLGPHTTWSAIDARSFGVAFSDRGRTVQARVSIDERGAPIDFETDHRYLRDPSDPTHALVRCRWSTPIESWHLVSGHPLPTRGSATWHLASGDYTYADFEPIPASFSLDVPPPPVVTCNDAVHCR